MEGVSSFSDLTPFQNQVLDAAEKIEAEKQEQRRQEQMPSSVGGKTLNSRGPAGGGNSGLEQEETVRYINEDENPDYFDE